MGGHLGAESVEGRGATFWLEFPLGAPVAGRNCLRFGYWYLAVTEASPL